MKFSDKWLRRPIVNLAVVGSAVMLSACSSTPTEIKALSGPSYTELMASADEAQAKGGAAEALGYFERAAKADPGKKQPWLRIAQAQFDARNYGSAITASQEVLQRDNTDVTAKSIMAASGLRVSASALEQLREANALGGSTREEAQSLARTMRDALGESILPATAAHSASESTSKPVVKRAPAPPAVRKPAQVVQPVVATPAAPVAAPAKKVPAVEPKRNPFDALKG